MNIYKQRVQNLRALMLEKGIDAYLILSADAHLSEYVSEFYKTRAFISGFKGSVGSLVLTQKEAFLWVDGRYTLAAQKELEGSGIKLAKEDSSKNFLQWLKENLKQNQVLATDFSVLALALKKEIEQNSKAKLLHYDLVSLLWKERPALPKNPIYEHKLKFCSFSREKKLELVREKMQALNADAHLLSSLDDIAWILNLRGSDVEYNPVFLAHLLILKNEALLFVDKKKLILSLENKLLKAGVKLRAYENVGFELAKLEKMRILIEPAKITALLAAQIPASSLLLEELNPSTLLKAVKTKKELHHIKKAMQEDGVALCEFFAWLEKALKNKQVLSELDIDEKITAFRAKSAFYVSNSFATIAAFNANAAFPHYKATKESFAMIKNDGFLLIDSGAQYENGTTDITRVVPVGIINKEQKRAYTLVLKAHIALARTIFPKDIAMPLLDSIARTPLWQEGLDYMHGTGHGVGYFLNVHEAPQVLSYSAPVLAKTKAKEAMITSIEPGIYKAGKWGVRLENLVVNVKAKTSEFGEFLAFESLSLCPFENSCIEKKLLNKEEKQWLNAYHKKVFKALAPHLKGKALAWLKKKTRSIA